MQALAPIIGLHGERSQSFPAGALPSLPSLDLNLSAYEFAPQQQGSQGFPGPAESPIATAGSASQGFRPNESMSLPQGIQQQLPQSSSLPQNYFYPVSQSTPVEGGQQGQYSALQPAFAWEQTEAASQAYPSSSEPFQAKSEHNYDAGMLQPSDSPMSNGNPGMS